MSTPCKLQNTKVPENLKLLTYFVSDIAIVRIDSCELRREQVRLGKRKLLPSNLPNNLEDVQSPSTKVGIKTFERTHTFELLPHVRRSRLKPITN